MNKKELLEDLTALANILMDNCKPKQLNKHDLQKYYEIEERIQKLQNEVELLEALVSKSREAPLAKATPTENTNTPDDLRKMRYAKTEQGQLRMAVDPAYKKRVESAYKDYYGEQSMEVQVTQ